MKLWTRAVDLVFNVLEAGSSLYDFLSGLRRRHTVAPIDQTEPIPLTRRSTERERLETMRPPAPSRPK